MMRPRLGSPALLLLLGLGGCSNPLYRGCERETGTLLVRDGVLEPAALDTYVVRSPKASNLKMTLVWNDPTATLKLRATITDCGVHTGCDMLTQQSMAAGSTSATLLVDGSTGKTWRVEVVNGAGLRQGYRLEVIYDTGTCT